MIGAKNIEFCNNPPILRNPTKVKKILNAPLALAGFLLIVVVHGRGATGAEAYFENNREKTSGTLCAPIFFLERKENMSLGTVISAKI